MRANGRVQFIVAPLLLALDALPELVNVVGVLYYLKIDVMQQCHRRVGCAHLSPADTLTLGKETEQVQRDRADVRRV